MELTQIIKKPILTEKTNLLAEKNNVYTFQVDWAANKYQIAQAVSFIFKVTVTDVNVIKIDKQPKRVGRFNGFTNRYKKAYVTLKKGDVINFYPTEEKETKKKEKVVKSAEEQAKTKAVEDKVAVKLAKKKASKKEGSEKPAETKKATTKKTVKKTDK